MLANIRNKKGSKSKCNEAIACIEFTANLNFNQNYFRIFKILTK